MNRNNYGAAARVVLIFSVTIALFTGIYIQSTPSGKSPLAERGVLDLSNWDFHNQGLVPLGGEWEFYEGELLEPADFRTGARPEISYLSVPGIWNGKITEGGMTRKGFGTYRLKVIVHDTDEVYGLKMRSIRMSHHLYINGRLEGESGLPAASEEVHIPGNTPYTAFFHTESREIEIVIQVANYKYVTGGIISSIPFGRPADITNLNGIQIGTDAGAVLILTIFGMYHFSFYFLRRKEKMYLYSGLYLLSLVFIQMLVGEKILLRLLPDIPFDIAYKLQDFSQFLSSAIIILFFCSINQRLMSFRTMVGMLSPIALYLAAVLTLPYAVHSEMKVFFWAYLGVVILSIVARMVFLYSRFQQDASDRKELILFIGMSVSLMIFLVDGTLYSENAVSTDLVGKLGVVGFIAFMNILLAVRFTNAFEKTEILSHQLAVSNQRKDEFLTYTSHEIKTPLHGIMNMTSDLLDDAERTLSPKQKQNLWLIKDTSIKLSMLIHDLIDVTRLKHGELRLHPVIVDVRVITQIVLDVLQFELLGRNVRLINQIDSDVWVLADENRLRQILYNLVHNAIKHTNKGVIKVMSSVIGERVSISVEDTGTGIAKDKYDAIFDYFEQLDQPYPEDGYTGMGVGLYISRKLVERMDGAIWIDWSEVGKGSRFTFTLPRVNHAAGYRELAYASSGQARVAHDNVPLDILDQHEHTILIVDDEASNIHILLNILRRYPYNVVTAFSAEEAMDKMKKHPDIDLVILDVMMPRISGIELCQLLREHYSILDLPILIATVKDTSHDIALGFRAGANDYVTKPFDAETLIARIQTLIAMKTSIQEAIRNEQAFHQAQIKPHFLYNALSSVISFCYTDGQKAAYLLAMLSQYLRYILDMDRNRLFVPLHRELELIHAYVEIEKARFGERFDFAVHVEENILDKEIPSLSIQPFVENAIRHGLFEKEGHGKVMLIIDEGEHYMKVIIEDNGMGIPDDLQYQLSKGEAQIGGIGISNIRKRLHSIPGATLTIDSEMGRGTKVTMYLPMQQEGEALQRGDKLV